MRSGKQQPALSESPICMAARALSVNLTGVAKCPGSNPLPMEWASKTSTIGNLFCHFDLLWDLLFESTQFLLLGWIPIFCHLSLATHHQVNFVIISKRLWWSSLLPSYLAPSSEIKCCWNSKWGLPFSPLCCLISTFFQIWIVASFCEIITVLVTHGNYISRTVSYL